MKAGMIGIGALLDCLASGGPLVACSHPTSKISSIWDRKAAAAYLDYRESWWAEWTGSARDHGTFCVPCHTALLYALSMPALRVALAETGPSVNECRLIEDVTLQVRLWKDVGPYYSDQGYDDKTAESRGTESVLNALILASHDAQSGQLSDDTRAAFDRMWAMQQSTRANAGPWPWLQFDQEPWAANDSACYAALAAMAVGTAPGNYASTPEIQGNLAHLCEYLNRESPAKSTINRIFLLWASTELPGILSQERQKAISHEAPSKQQVDGGWRLASITWKWSGWGLKSVANMWIRGGGTVMEGKSDGVATGLITLAPKQAGVPADNPQLKHGLSWLMSNQNAMEAFCPVSSVNKRWHISSDTGRSMSDAATAFAGLALTENQRTTNRTTGQVASVSNYRGSSH
jgi:squalene-hopene/tetraprenyl-beta-curcumene cyclase